VRIGNTHIIGCLYLHRKQRLLVEEKKFGKSIAHNKNTRKTAVCVDAETAKHVCVCGGVELCCNSVHYLDNRVYDRGRDRPTLRLQKSWIEGGMTKRDKNMRW
jgi:hypothetical protein